MSKIKLEEGRCRPTKRVLNNTVFRHCEEAQSADEAISPTEDEIASLRSQ